MDAIRKYPRTPHLAGSRRQPGDDLAAVPFPDISGRYVVAEEKLDGANAAISFDAAGRLRLQSRGHYLAGGPREKQFHLFKQWAAAVAPRLWSVLADRYILYGEWVYAKHTMYYDALPHYFFEFDILDTRSGDFLSTVRRREMLDGLPVVSVPVLWDGPATTPEHLTRLIMPSLYKSSGWRRRLLRDAADAGLDAEKIGKETDRSDLAEGLYLKVEEGGRVVRRMKLVRPDFLTTILDSGTHWLQRPILPNRLTDGVDLFAGVAS